MDTNPTPGKKRFWLIQLFHGRINRTEFLIGILIASLIYWISGYISFNKDLIEYSLKGISIFFFFSVITRRVSDADLYKNAEFEKAALLHFIRYYALLFWIYLFKEGNPHPNPDGPPPKKFTGSLMNLFALE